MLKEIPEFKGYFADSEGGIYSAKSDRYLKGHIINTGYMQMTLCKEGKKYYRTEHELILHTFIPIKNPALIITHSNGDKLKNDLQNLQYITRSEIGKRIYAARKDIWGKGYKTIVINKHTGEVQEFPSIRECSRKMNISLITLNAILNGLKHNDYDYYFHVIK